jgi:dTDP-4-amino-4,6-dideoxygalactose transaminase
VSAVFHYLPLHLSSFAENHEFGRWSREQRQECPVTEDTSARLLRLPLYNSLSEGDQSKVIEAVIHSFS